MSEYVPLTWDELEPYEQQQGGYWLYNAGPAGEDPRWIPVRPEPAGPEELARLLREWRARG